MRSITRSVLGLSIVALLSGCATIAHGRFQEVPVKSNPSGATVYADCGTGPKQVGETPVVVKLQRKADRCIITLRKDGFEESSAILGRSFSGWAWANLLLDDVAVVGAAVDLVDGAWYNRTPGVVKVELRPERSWRDRPATEGGSN